jgi:predicted XRE-type DNA-binding protein
LPKANPDTASLELAELVSIKRLLTFALLKSGATQNEVALALGVSQSTVSKMFPGGLPKPSGTKSGK